NVYSDREDDPAPLDLDLGQQLEGRRVFRMFAEQLVQVRSSACHADNGLIAIAFAASGTATLYVRKVSVGNRHGIEHAAIKGHVVFDEAQLLHGTFDDFAPELRGSSHASQPSRQF